MKKSKMAGNFEDLPLRKDDKEMLKDMYDTVSKLKLWDWLATPGVRGLRGFEFSSTPEMALISKNMGYLWHSGSSFNYVVNIMEIIAKKGWDKYVEDLKNTPTCHCRKVENLVGWCGVAGGGVPACEH